MVFLNGFLMSIYERDYQKDGYGRSIYDAGGSFFGNMPPMTRYLLYINAGVFIFANLFPFKEQFPPSGFWVNYFSVYPYDLFSALQIWRLISYQFMHDGLGHILFNMIALCVFGPMIERDWGSRAYLRFYLIAGAAGGVVYTLLAGLHVLPMGSLVGASGSILGLIAVAGILFPNQEMMVLGLIPVRMSIIAIIAAIMAILGFLSGENAGGQAAHLSGIAVGVFYVYVRPRLIQRRMTRSKGAWQKKLEQEKQFSVEVDRVLEKVHQDGIGSLTRKEKDLLKEATRREQQEAARAR
jgi:membrane associated rhomboid family serine protease